MGTSLSGLTPATTFDGLLKTSDNEPLDGTLKAISTGDGTDTILSLSNSALSIGGSVTANEVFAGTSGFTFLRTENNARAVLRTFAGDGKASFYNAVKIGDSISPTAQLQVVGSGATSATTSLLVQNSSGTDLFSIKDNGLFTFNDDGGGDALTIENGSNISQIRYNDNLWLGSSHGTYVPTLKIDRLNGLSVETNSGSLLNLLYDTGNLGIGETTPTARLHVKGSGNDNTTTSLLVQNSDATDLLKVSDDGVSNVWLPSSGLKMQRSSACRLEVRGVGAATNIDISPWSGSMSIGGANVNKVSVGSTTPLDSKFSIKGSGATSATTALLVQNSAGTELFKVQDDGRVNVALGLKISNLNVIDWDAGTSAVRYFYQSGVGNHVFYTNSGTERMKLNNDGNLGIAETTPTARLHIKGSGNDATTTALLVQNSDGDDMVKITDDSDITLSKLVTIRNSSAGLFARMYADGYGAGGPLMWVNGSVNLGSAPSTAAKLSVKGSGATSATTALLVKNSAGTDLLNIRDDGQIRFNAYYANNLAIFPTGAQNLGVNNVQQWHFGNIYSKGVTHITDNTTSSTTLDASAKLQVDSTTQGFLPPRMTTTERDAISTPAAGLMVYNTTTNKAQCYNGTAWQDLF